MTTQLEKAKAELLKWQVIVEYLEGIDKQKPTAHKRQQIIQSVRRGRMTAAGRKRISIMMKKRWKEAKKLNKTRL